MLKKHTVTE